MSAALGLSTFGRAADLPPPSTITDPSWIWAMPGEEKARVHHLRFEGRISYYDPGFNMLWLEQDHVSTYVQLVPPAPPLRTGQHVVIEGTIIPAQGLTAETVRCTVVREDEPAEPVAIAAGRINDMAAYHGHMVSTEAYVDGQQLIDGDHLRLSLIVQNRPVIGWIKPDDPDRIPNWQGSFVRVQALYSGRFDPTQTRTTIELWMGRQSDLQILANIGSSAAFTVAPTAIKDLSRVPAGTPVLVQGTVQAHDVGVQLAIRDDTGQVSIRSIQQQRLPLGARVEAVGTVTLAGSGWILDNALYRPAFAPAQAAPLPADDRAVRTVTQIRELSSDEAARGRPVVITGMVTWSMPGTDFFFLQDMSGGIRVRYGKVMPTAPALGKYFEIEGTTTSERFAPAIELTHYNDLGAMSPPAARPVAYDQAITGREDGQWVEMRGFLQRTVSDHDWRWIYVTTPDGEFVAHLQSPVNFVANPGSLIRVRGVCETNVDHAGRVAGVTLRVPFLHDITIEEDAPADIFNLPLRAIKDLNQLAFARNLTRVRVAGTVLHAVPGREIYVEEGTAALLILGRQTTPLLPGDRIEAVGILGREGARTILREAVFRKTGAPLGLDPPPLIDAAHPSRHDDSRLVRVRGVLLDRFDLAGRTRLTLQSDKTLFEAGFERPADGSPEIPVGAGLELTGLYQLEFDDSRQIRGFHLELRSPADVVVYQSPRVWTVRRAFIVTGVLGGCTLLVLAWVAALRRRVRRQTEQIRAQLEHQTRLEIEVQRAARLESLGILAGGIAHDFNNALTGIMGYVSIAMLDRQAMILVGDCLQQIERGAKRARDLTQQLLTFAKGGDPIRADLILPEVVQESTSLVLHGTTVPARFDIPPGLWPVHADQGQINQVFQNLTRNAVQAMPRGGQIHVTFDNEEITGGVKKGLTPGRYVRVRFADNGEGISREHLSRIFEPYFSTRKAGSGLGLATVHSILRKHQGLVEVQSTPGQGTVFTLWLPAAQAEKARVVSAARKAPRATRAPPRLLLVDDEESIQQLGRLALQRMGFDATVAADGAGALREFDQALQGGRPFDLVILDLTLPGGLGGQGVLELMRKSDPDVLAIVSSGYSSDPVMARFRDYGFQGMVPKPYSIEQFTHTVEKVLEEGLHAHAAG